MLEREISGFTEDVSADRKIALLSLLCSMYYKGIIVYRNMVSGKEAFSFLLL